MLDALWIDIRHSLRGLRRSPGFSVAVIATVALAIAANTAIFSLLNAIVLRPVPASDPDRLVAISTTDSRTTQQGFIHADTFTAFRAQQRSFATLSMYNGGFYPRIDARGATAYAGLEGVTSEYFALVGARVAAGRLRCGPRASRRRHAGGRHHRSALATDVWRRFPRGRRNVENRRHADHHRRCDRTRVLRTPG